MVVNIVKGFASDVAVGDHHRSQRHALGGAANVDDVFAPDGGLVIGEGDGRAAVMQGEQRHVFGRHMGGMHLIGLDFEMSQFWQKKQPMLQPAVPMEKTLVPGRK